MPGLLLLDATVAELAGQFGAEPDGSALPPPGERTPGDTVAAMVSDGGRRLVAMRWGMIPMGRTNARGRPVLDTIVNARSETLLTKSAFAGLGRCVLPVSGWFEWSGTARRRTCWRISDPAEPVLAFAAVFDRWEAPGGPAVLSLATVTCPPNAEVAVVHDRMPVLLDRADLPRWLGEVEGDVSPLLRAPPDGSLSVEPAAQK